MRNFRHLRTFLPLLIAVFALMPYNGFCNENVAQGVKVIVIDAGHGGSRYPGASYNNIYEKDINLQVALKLGALINKHLPEIKVVYTRTTDKIFSTVLSEDLQARADIAHKNEGDLFISIHSNAHSNREVRGVETIIMGESSQEQQRNENALYLNNKEELLDMSDQKTAAIVRAYIQNLQFTYGEYSEMMARLIQDEYSKLGLRNRGVRRQLLKVLYATDMPSVLTEIGFMSNAEDLAYITSEKGQDEICNAIFRAVKAYVTNVRRALLVDVAPVEKKIEEKSVEEPKPQTPEPIKQRVKPQKATKRYTIQLLASSKLIPTSSAELKGYKNRVWVLELTGAMKYKYCYGDFKDKASAQKELAEVRKEFSQAFVISYEKKKP